MKWSWKIGEFLGIGLYIHATFPLLLVLAAYPALVYGHNITAALGSIAFILVLFLCVVLHEYGHAIAARRYGIKTQDITLLPIGGVARLERMPENPAQELVIAAAGPMVNVVIAAALFAFTLAVGSALNLRMLENTFVGRLLLVNVVLVLFNLIPAFPMDGGRILRALLAMRLDYARATQYAAWLGQGIAALFVVGGFFVNPLLIVTGLFIFMGAQGEAQMVKSRSKMAGVTAGQAMRTNIRTLAASEWLASVVNQMSSAGQQDYPVMDNGRLVGVLTRERLLRGLQEKGAYETVGAVMQPDVPTIDVEQPLTQASETMAERALTAMPVTQQGTLVGLLTFESIREFMALQKALHSRPRPAGQMPMA